MTPFAQPLLTPPQWALMTEAQSLAQSQGIRVMPGVPLAEWLGDLKALDPEASSALAALKDTMSLYRMSGTPREHVLRTSVLLSFLMVQSGNALCLAVCDNTVSAWALRALGVQVYEWTEIAASQVLPAALVREAGEQFMAGRYRLVKPHWHHETIDERLQSALLLKMPRRLEEANLSDAAQGAVDAYLGRRRAELLVLREVALSRFLTESAAADQAQRDLRLSSSVDFLVYARPPLGVPLAVLEYDGAVHRSNPRKQENDRAKDAMLLRAGIPIVRVASNLAPAQAVQMGPRHCEVHPRLPILLGLLAEMSDLALRNSRRAHWLAGRLSRQIGAFGEREFEALTSAEQEHVLRWLLRDQADHALENAEGQGWTPSLEEQLNDRIEQLLLDAGIDPEIVSHFAIESSSTGRRATGRLKLPTGGQIRLETVSVALTAPGMRETDCKQFVDRHLRKAFVDAASERLSGSSIDVGGSATSSSLD